MQVFEQCPLRFDYQYITKSHRDKGSEASVFGNRVHEAFELYLRDREPLSDDLKIFQSVLDRVLSMPGDKFYELEMAVTRDLAPVSFDDSSAWLRGIADFAVVDGKRGAAGDWKTGKPRDSTEQLKLMAGMLFAKFPELEEISTTYVWLYHVCPPSKVVYTRDMAPDIWNHFRKRTDEIDQAIEGGVLRAKPSGLCPWCPAYDTCPSARRRRG